MADELLKVRFTGVVRVLTIGLGGKSVDAEMTFYSCGTCGALVDDDDADKQTHTNWHAEVERHARDLHAHTNAFTGHGTA